MGRRSRGTRWCPENSIALCAGCHIFFTGHPLLFYEWLKAEIGEDRLDWLKFVSKKPTKFTDSDLKLLETELRNRLEDMRKK